MHEEDHFKEIRKNIAEVYEAERGKPLLYPIDESFYLDSIKLLQHLWDKYLSAQESSKDFTKAPIYMQEYRNLKKVIYEIYYRREKKIVRLAISQAAGNQININPLISSEKHLLKELSKALQWHREHALGDRGGEVKASVSVDRTAEEFSPEATPIPPPSSKIQVKEDSFLKKEEVIEKKTKNNIITGIKEEKNLYDKKQKEERKNANMTEKTLHQPPQGGLFGLNKLLVVENNIGEIATIREEKISLRKGDILFTDKEVMEAIVKGKNGNIIDVDL